MRDISTIEFHRGSKEELLPDFESDFPYIASRVDMNRYMGNVCPWHWHSPVELFYMESGTLEYHMPGGMLVFPAGSGGLVNSNVLHMTRPRDLREQNVQFLHIFDPFFIAGGQDSRIARKYVLPLITAQRPEIIPLYPTNPKQAKILEHIRVSFSLSERDMGYELRVREALSEIWVELLALAGPALEEKKERTQTGDKIKLMMVYIHEHYAKKISIAELAGAGFCSERECFRAFQECLHMTPVEYMQSYRLQMACRMLTEGRKSMTSIGQTCGLGSSSYFGKVFREHMGCTPLEYRQKWQDSDR